jgi:transcriptional regulator with XRE-family HTH domain
MNTETKKRLYQLVRKARGENSQRAFAISLGVSSTAVQHWENGTSMPEAKHLSQIAAIVGYSLAQVMDYLNGSPLPELDITSEVVSYVNKMSFKQLTVVTRAVSDRLYAIAESVG